MLDASGIDLFDPPADFAPGDEASVSAVVSNAGRGTTEGEVTVEFYLSTDGVVGPDDVLLGSQTCMLSPGSGEGANFDIEDAIVRYDVFPNLYRVLVRIISDTDPAEVDTANNTDLSDSTHRLVLFFGTFGGRKNVELDFLGATYSLKSGGFGQIVGVKTFTDVNGSDDSQPVLSSHAPKIIQAVSIELHDTTKRSTARVKLPRGGSVRSRRLMSTDRSVSSTSATPTCSATSRSSAPLPPSRRIAFTAPA